MSEPGELEIAVPISPGELIDKITILEIKSERLTDSDRRANVRRELDLLRATRDAALTPTSPAASALADLARELRAVNEALWAIEDDIRDCEREGDFGATFIALARAVYRTNDKRAAIKRQINDLLGSRLVEEKSYTSYLATRPDYRLTWRHISRVSSIYRSCLIAPACST